MRRAIDGGHQLGPRLRVAGEFICSTSGTWDVESLPYSWVKSLDLIADGPDEVRSIVRRRARAGADFIKIGLSKGPVGDQYHPWGDDPLIQAVSYSPEEVEAAVDEARRQRMKISAHCIGDEPVRLALDGGIDVIEHGYSITDDTRRRLADSGVPVVTTITQLYHHRQAFETYRYSPAERTLFEKHTERMRIDFEAGLKAGIRYTLGSDLIGPPTHPQWEAAHEFALAVEWGMDPMQTIVAGTKRGAEVLGMETKIGTLEPGKFADLIAVDGDPLLDIALLQSPSFVMLGGKTITENSEVRPT